MFFSLPNQTAHTTTNIEKPWEVADTFVIPPEAAASKEDYMRWVIRADVQHAFISGVAGFDPRVRVSLNDKDDALANPPRYLHAVIADYDAAASQRQIDAILEDPASGYVPNWICDSYQPGRKRLIWLCESPLLLAGYKDAYAVFRLLAKELKVAAWLKGFDKNAFDPKHYFAIGKNWKPLNPEPLPSHILRNWAAVAGAEIRYDTAHSAPPPIELIADEVESRFPGRWTGPFNLGARGVRFWAPEADNPTAAVVCPDGMRCFTGGQGFVRWEEIFGKKTIDEMRGEAHGALRERVVYDGQRYWLQADKDWVQRSKEDMVKFLHCSGLSRLRVRGAPSEIDRFEVDIHSRNSVEAALPFVHAPQGVFMYKGERFLNISKARPIMPAPPMVAPDLDFHSAGPKAFPWLHGFLSELFVPAKTREKYVDPDVPAKYIQLIHFLAWLQRFYTGAVSERPQLGHALVIAGPQSAGKTFLNHGVVGTLVGGSADASDFLVRDSQWTDDLCKKPIMSVDDSSPGDDPTAHRRFSTLVKKAAANIELTYNKKYGSTGRVAWPGRVIVTCNTDPDSLRIIPDMTQSNLDKIMLFMTKAGVPLPGWHEQDEILARELPHLGRFLMDWKPPHWVINPGDNRFYVRPYHHPTLLEVATEQGTVVNVLEMLREVYDIICTSEDKSLAGYGFISAAEKETGEKAWEFVGPVRRLCRVMRELNIPNIQRFTMSQIATILGQLSSRGFNVNRVSDRHGEWRILFDKRLLSSTTEQLVADPVPEKEEGAA